MTVDYQEQYEKLAAMIREGASYRDLTRFVGPSEEENELARLRIERMDALSELCEWGAIAYSSRAYRARRKYEELDAQQTAFEERYC